MRRRLTQTSARGGRPVVDRRPTAKVPAPNLLAPGADQRRLNRASRTDASNPNDIENINRKCNNRTNMEWLIVSNLTKPFAFTRIIHTHASSPLNKTTQNIHSDSTESVHYIPIITPPQPMPYVTLDHLYQENTINNHRPFTLTYTWMFTEQQFQDLISWRYLSPRQVRKSLALWFRCKEFRCMWMASIGGPCNKLTHSDDIYIYTFIYIPS